MLSQGVYSSRHNGTAAVTLASGVNTVDVSGTDTLKRLGIGAFVEIQQNSVKINIL